MISTVNYGIKLAVCLIQVFTSSRTFLRRQNMNVKIVKQSFEVMTPFSAYDSFLFDLEYFGRICYKSEGQITFDSCRAFVRRLIRSGHESVLEHVNLTVKFIIDRAMANALVRHRHCAFSQESTHYINYLKHDELQVIQQPDFPELAFYETVKNIVEQYARNEAIQPKVRRCLLPLCLKTELVMTTNLREWRYILRLRTGKNCHPQMRELMLSLLDWFRANLTILVEDIVGDIEIEKKKSVLRKGF